MLLLPRLLPFVIFAAAVLLSPGAAVGEDEVEEGFTVRSASTQLNDNVYFLNAVMEAQLPEYIRSAVDQGFELPISMEIEFYRARSLWFDERIIYIKQQYRIRYHTLLDVVSVYDVNAGMSRYFANLDEALDRLMVVYNSPILDRNNLEAEQEYRGRLRFGIDSEELPLPLKSSSLWRNNWELASDWFEWELAS
jgi:hypothetical protein